MGHQNLFYMLKWVKKTKSIYHAPNILCIETREQIPLDIEPFLKCHSGVLSRDC